MSDKEAADTVKIFSFLEFNVILHFSITHSGKKPSHISAVQKTPKEASPLKENAFRTQCWVWLESLKEFSKKKKSGFRKGRGICAFKTKAFNFIFILK